MPCDTLTFDIDDATYQRLYNQAVGAQAIFSDNIVQWHGMTFSWKHADGKLTVECLTKPFYVPCGKIESELRALVEKARYIGQ